MWCGMVANASGMTEVSVLLKGSLLHGEGQQPLPNRLSWLWISFVQLAVYPQPPHPGQIRIPEL